MKEKIKKYLVPFIFIIIIFLLFFSNVIKEYPTDLDELWNYNTARCIKNGLIPYTQISMITTPLLPTIVAIILKITVDQLLVFRILHALLVSAILFITYKIFRRCKIGQIGSLILSGISASILYNTTALDYNYFALFITLIIEYLELKTIDDNKDRNILLGLLAGLSILTKQTVGMFICMYVQLTPLIIDKSDKKIKIKMLVKRIIGAATPCIAFIIYLLVTNSFMDFINYAILGIKTFNNSVSYFETLKIAIHSEIFVLVMLPIMLLVQITAMIFDKKLRYNKKQWILILSSIPLLIVLYPICDYIHYIIGTYILLVSSLNFLYYFLKKCYDKINIKVKDYVLLSIKMFIILIMFFYAARIIVENINEYKENYQEKNIINHYENLPVSNRQKEINLTLKKLIENNANKNIILADSDACAYTIPFDNYKKNYDMFLKGNIGKDGEDGIIEEIKNSSNTIYILKNRELPLNWQAPVNAINYIRENSEYVGDLDIFEIYYKE